MPAHTAQSGSRRPVNLATWTAFPVIAMLAAAGTSTATTRSPDTPASVVAAADPDGHAPTLTGAGSRFDAPFFSMPFARYQQQHPGVTIGYSAVGSSAGIAAFSAGQVDFGASDVPMTASEAAGFRSVQSHRIAASKAPVSARSPLPGLWRARRSQRANPADLTSTIG